jgi:hypothetical protein
MPPATFPFIRTFYYSFLLLLLLFKREHNFNGSLSGGALYFYKRGAWFESLTETVYSVSSLRPSRKYDERILLGHDHFLPNLFEFISRRAFRCVTYLLNAPLYRSALECRCKDIRVANEALRQEGVWREWF